jgi:hypothetical protein
MVAGGVARFCRRAILPPRNPAAAQSCRRAILPPRNPAAAICPQPLAGPVVAASARSSFPSIR